MDFGLAFTYVFKDPRWPEKILIPGLVALIPIVGVIVDMGWALEIQRRVMRADPEPLPELQFGKNLRDGAYMLVIGLIYSIPLWILLGPVWFPFSWVVQTPAQGPGTAAFVLFTLFSSTFGMVGNLYAVLEGYVLPAAYGRFATSDRLESALDFGHMYQMIRVAPVAFLLALAGTWIGGLIATAGILVAVIGVIFTFPYGQAVAWHLSGQAVRQANQALGEPAAAD